MRSAQAERSLLGAQALVTGCVTGGWRAPLFHRAHDRLGHRPSGDHCHPLVVSATSAGSHPKISTGMGSTKTRYCSAPSKADPGELANL